MDIALIGILTFLASVAGTLGGFGTSTIMIAVLSLFYPLPQILLLVGAIHWFDDLWKMILFRKGIRWGLILGFGIPGMLASYMGARITIALPEEPLLWGLGLAFILYSAYLIAFPDFRLPQNAGTTAAGGCLSGFLAGMLGLGGAARAAFLAAFDLPAAVYIAASGGIAFLIDSTRLATYLLGGVKLTRFPSWGFLLFISASFAGALAARSLAGRIPPRHYRTLVAILLLAFGLRFIIFGK